MVKDELRQEIADACGALKKELEQTPQPSPSTITVVPPVDEAKLRHEIITAGQASLFELQKSLWHEVNGRLREVERDLRREIVESCSALKDEVGHQQVDEARLRSELMSLSQAGLLELEGKMRQEMVDCIQVSNIHSPGRSSTEIAVDVDWVMNKESSSSSFIAKP